MLKYSKKILNIITNILVFIIAIVVLVILYNFIQLKLLKKDYVSFFGYSFFEVVSGSMEPTISINDIIIVKNSSEIEQDEIITYKSGDSFVTHRVISVQGDYFITRGDANNSKDVPVHKGNLIGKVVKIIPDLGIWKTIFTTPKVLLSICVTLFLFNLAFSYTDKNKTNKKYNDFGIYYNSIIEEFEGDNDV